IRDDEVEKAPRHGVVPGAADQLDALLAPMRARVPARHLERLRARIGRDDAKRRPLAGERHGDGAAAGAEVEDGWIAGPRLEHARRGAAAIAITREPVDLPERRFDQ